MTTTRKVFRYITLGLQIAAILAYYLPTLINGGYMGIIWLAIGVVHTAAFCAMFFRDYRTRTGLSIAIMVILTLWSLAVLILVGIIAIVAVTLGISASTGFIYAACSLLASIFALSFPRKYILNNYWHGNTYSQNTASVPQYNWQ